MQMIKTFSGYCPIQQREVSIPITYIENSPIGQRRFEKGASDCPFAGTSGKCSTQCPIKSDAPSVIILQN